MSTGGISPHWLIS